MSPLVRVALVVVVLGLATALGALWRARNGRFSPVAPAVLAAAGADPAHDETATDPCDAAPDHWDVIEGQGSLFHPAYAGVSLGLLHGSQPDVIVMCHEPGRTQMAGTPGYKVPDIEEAIELTLRLGRRTNAAIRCAGVSFNTSALSGSAAEARIAEWSERLNLPVADPIRGGAAFDRLVEACLA